MRGGWLYELSNFGNYMKGKQMLSTAIQKLFGSSAQAQPENPTLTYVRGRKVVSEAELIAEVNEKHAHAAAGKPVRLGNVPIPAGREVRNVMVTGAVGTGKFVAIKQVLKDAEAAGQGAIVYDITGAYVDAFYRPERGDVILSTTTDARATKADEFSIRDWVSCQGGWEARDPAAMLFLHTDVKQAALKEGLVEGWIAEACHEIMVSGDPTTKAVKTWLVIEDLETLGRMPILLDTLTQARKYGLAHLIGFQSIAQIQEIYGEDQAFLIVANSQHKVILRCGESGAKYWADAIGAGQFWEVSTFVYTQHHPCFPCCLGFEAETKRLIAVNAVLPSEIEALSDLEGYVVLGGFDGTAKVKLSLNLPG